ncbi:polyketide cyclase [Niveispirillum irakense]|uniref:polyketide cyclase n=1 Tax=Niveispirillum irakense TaxID=34011 RepID=UPI00048B9039|nr:polyketide cyclase [Niveispirillum irakense]
MNMIHWPDGYVPGFSDNFASNEIIVADLSAHQVWPALAKTTIWPRYYSNVSDIWFYDGQGPALALGTRFRFVTFGFSVEAEVVEYVEPVEGQPARLAWHGWVEGDAHRRLDVHHAWLIEDLSDGRVRILTQETQNGQPARELAAAIPNPMINGHQEWIVGMVTYARCHLV